MTGEIHVHYTTLALAPDAIDLLSDLLNGEESARADRFRMPVIRRRFIAARAFLRKTLGTYLDADPRHLEFTYGPLGKPGLSGAPIFFNLSHTDDFALLAVSRHGDVGADVERVRPRMRHADIARRYFSARETEWLLSLPEHERPAGFFDRWTAKEAYVKARGDGLSFPLDAFHALPGDGPFLEFEVYGDPRESARWSIQPLPLAGDLHASVAAEGRDWSVLSFHG